MISFEGVSKAYAGRAVVDGLDLTIAAGELTVLIGPSGCGKSTTLRMINRLIAPDSGIVRVDGRDVTAQDPQTLRRGIGYAIQAGGLFAHWNVARNVATVPNLLGWPKARIDARVDELLSLLGLSPAEFRHKRVGQLSGGQQQRVGVARALAADPKLLLLDEPFGALDPITRGGLQTALRRIQRATAKTMVFVTHDMDEALLLADCIVILKDGRLAQAGTPAEIVEQPASDFVRGFVAGEAAALRGLAVRRVGEVCRPGRAEGAPEIGPEATLRDALSLMVTARVRRLAVRGRDSHVALDDIVGDGGC